MTKTRTDAPAISDAFAEAEVGHASMLKKNVVNGKAPNV